MGESVSVLLLQKDGILFVRPAMYVLASRRTVETAFSAAPLL